MTPYSAVVLGSSAAHMFFVARHFCILNLVKYRYTIGIDEAGRGPLAGPVSVGVVCIDRSFNTKLIAKAKDSKILSEKVREEIFIETRKLYKAGRLNYAVSLVHVDVIDAKGISYAIKLAIRRCLKKINISPQDARVLLDGSLKAPDAYVHQKTIIKGDQKEKIISLASIMAKVTRDRWMKRVAKKYPVYGFEIHKGYGTQKHRDLIKKHGPSSIHRKSFCTHIL